MHQHTSNFSWNFETSTVITFLFIQADHGMGIMWLVLQSFHRTPNFHELADSASNFTAEIWATIKALDEMKDASASKFIIFTDSHSCLQAFLRSWNIP